MKKLLCVLAVLTLACSMAACGRQAAQGDSTAVSSIAATEPAAPDAALSASLTELLDRHSIDTWYHHIEKAQVYREGGTSRAEIRLKAGSTQYAEAAAGLAGLFSDGQLDAFFPGLCGAAKELGLGVETVAALGKLFYQLTTQDDAQNYYQIEKLGLPVFELLADITGEKVSKIKADIDDRIVDDEKVAEVLFQALDEAYAPKSGEITQSEMTRIAGMVLTEFQDTAIGKVLFLDSKGTVLKEIG